MAAPGLEGIDETVQKTHIWINDVSSELGFDAKHRAFAALRATLHTLRDHLTIDESAQFSAQLPLLLRGVYFEGWDPSHTHVKERDAGRFLEHIAEEIPFSDVPNPTQATRGVARVIGRHVSRGEVEDVVRSLPGPIRELFSVALEPGQQN